jgi:2-aminoethylphosphonate-pyruvate transaminase
MIKTAVILAAGLGSRFNNKTKDRPKGFVDFMGKPMIIHSIENLIQVGIEEIIIGIGYQASWYKNLENKYSQVICIEVDNYHSTGSLFTFFSCRNFATNDFLLLESDIVYEIQALKKIINTKGKNRILVSSLIKFQDQQFIETNDELELVNWSFDRNKLNKIDGEWVGISKISIETYKEICTIFNSNPSKYEKLAYEDIFILNKLNSNFYVKYISNILWYEIDCEEDLIEAERIFDFNRTLMS